MLKDEKFKRYVRMKSITILSNKKFTLGNMICFYSFHPEARISRKICIY